MVKLASGSESSSPPCDTGPAACKSPSAAHPTRSAQSQRSRAASPSGCFALSTARAQGHGTRSPRSIARPVAPAPITRPTVPRANTSWPSGDRPHPPFRPHRRRGIGRGNGPRRPPPRQGPRRPGRPHPLRPAGRRPTGPARRSRPAARAAAFTASPARENTPTTPPAPPACTGLRQGFGPPRPRRRWPRPPPHVAQLARGCRNERTPPPQTHPLHSHPWMELRSVVPGCRNHWHVPRPTSPTEGPRRPGTVRARAGPRPCPRVLVAMEAGEIPISPLLAEFDLGTAFADRMPEPSGN